MTVLIITLLFIWATIATAMAQTFWAAWRYNIEDLAHAYDQIDQLTPAITEGGNTPLDEYGEDGDETEGAVGEQSVEANTDPLLAPTAYTQLQEL